MKKILVGIISIIALIIWTGLYLFYMKSIIGKIILYSTIFSITIMVVAFIVYKILRKEEKKPNPPQIYLPTTYPQKVDSVGKVEMGAVRWFVIFILTIVFAISTIMLIGGYKIGNVNIGGILLGIEVAYLVFSFGYVKNDEVAAMFVFGEPIGLKYMDGSEDPENGDLKPGLYFAPLGIIEVQKENGTIYQDELPGNPEQIFRQEDKTRVPDGLFPPIRIKFGQPREFKDSGDPDDKLVENDPYNVALTVEVAPVVSWRIGSATIFFKRMKTVGNCRKILTDKAEAIFGDKFAGVTPAKASLRLGQTSQELEKILREQVEEDGVMITDAYVKPFRYSHNLNLSIENVSIATQNARSTVISAEAEKQKSLKAGEAIAKNREILLLAEAAGAAKLAEVVKLPEGQITVWMQTMSRAFENANYSIVPGSELFTAVTGISEAVKQMELRRTKP